MMCGFTAGYGADFNLSRHLGTFWQESFSLDLNIPDPLGWPND
jgi:hypothetical protein